MKINLNADTAVLAKGCDIVCAFVSDKIDKETIGILHENGTRLYGKTVGVIGTGRIGQVFIDICKGFGMKVISCNPFPTEIDGVTNVARYELYAQMCIY